MNAPDRIDWTDGLIATLRQLWAEGITTTEIGRRMGLSKNAIVGKAHRIDLPPRPSPIRLARTGAPPPRRASVPKLADIMPLPIMALAAPIAPITATRPSPTRPPHPRVVASTPTIGDKPCCWPIGQPRTTGFRFCEAPALVGKPYCGEHASLAYARVRDRREDMPTQARIGSR